MTGFMAMMKNTCVLAENARFWFTIELQFDRVFAPIFKRLNDLKYHKIMTRALLLCALFDIGGETKRFWVDHFSPQYASGGTTCLRGETTIFSPACPQAINLHAISSLDMFPDCRSGLLEIYGLLGSITFRYRG
jgi:hypothetical protein